ncbi:MAG: HD domain-containing protein [Bdellovibrionales bacterium]|nr:HD domain-containing protein [Bdellovibrionales bacterium]
MKTSSDFEEIEKNSGKQFVQNLKEKDAVETIFLAQEKMELTDKNGRAYLSLNLADVTGSIDGKVWEKAEVFSKLFSPGDFISVKGHVQLYQNRRQLVIHDLRKAPLEKIDLKDFVVGAVRSPTEMLAELVALVQKVEDDHIRELILATINDGKVKERLLLSPAAKTIHHASVGGLLEHILSICGIVLGLSEHYPFLNRDYMLFGAIFHDIGKIWELEIAAGFQYTDKGRLVGHMGIACQMIDEKAGQILGFPTKLRDELKHIVLSHHGRLEYGSPKRPKFLEAMVVAMIDDLDSKINTMMGALKAEMDQGESWTRYNQHFDRYLYVDIFRQKLAKLGSQSHP